MTTYQVFKEALLLKDTPSFEETIPLAWGDSPVRVYRDGLLVLEGHPNGVLGLDLNTEEAKTLWVTPKGSYHFFHNRRRNPFMTGWRITDPPVDHGAFETLETLLPVVWGKAGAEVLRQGSFKSFARVLSSGQSLLTAPTASESEYETILAYRQTRGIPGAIEAFEPTP